MGRGAGAPGRKDAPRLPRAESGEHSHVDLDRLSFERETVVQIKRPSGQTCTSWCHQRRGGEERVFLSRPGRLLPGVERAECRQGTLRQLPQEGCCE